MSEFMIRNLATACAEEIGPHVDHAVSEVVRQRLPATIERILRRDYAGETLRLYVPKNPSVPAATETKRSGSNTPDTTSRNWQRSLA